MTFLKRNGPLLLIALAILIAPTVGFAALTLSVSNTTTFQQQLNNPCVIGDASCKQPTGWNFSQYSGTPGPQVSPYDLFSPASTNTGSASCGFQTPKSGIGQGGNGCIGAEYTVAQIVAVSGAHPNVGI